MRNLLTQHGVDFTPVDGTNELRLDCPMCGDIKQHFYYNTKKNKGHCKRCQHSVHDSQQLFQDLDISIENEKGDFIDPLKTYSMMLESYSNNSCKEIRIKKIKSSIILPDSVPALKSKRARKYLMQKRGLTEEQIEFYDLRYCRECETGKECIFDRIIIPIKNTSGIIISYLGRSVANENFRYQNPKGSKLSTMLYNIGNIFSDTPVNIVEGVFCVFYMGGNTVATFGKKISDVQVEILQDLGIKQINLLLDYDGRRVSKKLADKLSKIFIIKNVRIPAIRKRDGRRIKSSPDDFPLHRLNQIINKTPIFNGDDRKFKWLENQLIKERRIKYESTARRI